jgi:hypothetical protein
MPNDRGPRSLGHRPGEQRQEQGGGADRGDGRAAADPAGPRQERGDLRRGREDAGDVVGEHRLVGGLDEMGRGRGVVAMQASGVDLREELVHVVGAGDASVPGPGSPVGAGWLGGHRSSPPGVLAPAAGEDATEHVF